MSKLTFLQKFNNNVFDKYSVDGGKMLIHMGALGWVLSSLAQIGVVATDKNISKKDKKFLVPQEICDGLTNVVLYYTVSQVIKGSGDYLINNGYLLTDEAYKALSFIKDESVPSRAAIKGIKELFNNRNVVGKKSLKKNPLACIFANCEKLEGYQKLTPAQKNELKKMIPEVMDKIGQFKCGLGVITSVIASVIASNLLTPVARNKMAGLYQQKFLMQHDEAQKSKTYAPQPLPAAFNTFRMSSGLKI